MTNDQRQKLVSFFLGSSLCEVDYDFDTKQPRHYEVINGYKITYDKGKSFTVYPDGSLSVDPDKTPDQLDKILLVIATERLGALHCLLGDLTDGKDLDQSARSSVIETIAWVNSRRS